MAIAIYEDLAGKHHWAETTSHETLQHLAAGEWVLFDDTPDTPPPAPDGLDAAVASRLSSVTSLVRAAAAALFAPKTGSGSPAAAQAAAQTYADQVSAAAQSGAQQHSDLVAASKADLVSGRVPDAQLPTRLSDVSLKAAIDAEGDARYRPFTPTSAALTASADTAIGTVMTSTLNSGRVDSFSGNRVGETVITLPPGRWLVTNPGVFMSGTASDGRRTRGLTIQGSGRYTTEVVFDPATAAYLFDNQDRVSRITLRDITFTGNSSNASFMNSVSNGGPQDMVCERVVWRGTWNYGFYLSGTDVNSEFTFFACSVLGTWGTFLYNSNNPQVLNHNFIACNVEPDTGDMLNYQLGGHINIWGGSWIGAKNNSSGTGTFIILGPSSALGVNRLQMNGVRIEYRTGTYKLINSQWSTGVISFSDMQDTGYQSNAANEPTFTRAVFSSSAGSNPNWPSIIFQRCRLYGMHQYISLGQSDAYSQDIAYRDCVIQNFSDMSQFAVTTLDASVSTRIGAVAMIRFDGCRSGSNTSSTVYTDQTLNGHIARNAELRYITVNMHNGFGTLPATGDTALTLTVPMNAIITKVRAYGRAASSSGTNAGWSYVLQTSESTPTVLFSKGGADTGAGQSTGFNLTTEPWFICDSGTKRQLTLTAGANTSGSGTRAHFLVEYLA